MRQSFQPCSLPRYRFVPPAKYRDPFVQRIVGGQLETVIRFQPEESLPLDAPAYGSIRPTKVECEKSLCMNRAWSRPPTTRGRQVIAQVPMGRYGQPKGMVGAALWLISDAASYVTGSIMTVDGGFRAASGV